MPTSYTAMVMVAVPVTLDELRAVTGKERYCGRERVHKLLDPDAVYCAKCACKIQEVPVQDPTESYAVYLKEHKMEEEFALSVNDAEVLTDKTPAQTPYLMCLEQECHGGCQHEKLGLGVLVASTSSYFQDQCKLPRKGMTPDTIQGASTKVCMVAHRLGLKHESPIVVLQMRIG